MRPATLAASQEPLIPEDMLTKITSLPFSNSGLKYSAYCCGVIWDVVTFVPSFSRR